MPTHKTSNYKLPGAKYYLSNNSKNQEKTCKYLD